MPLGGICWDDLVPPCALLNLSYTKSVQLSHVPSCAKPFHLPGSFVKEQAPLHSGSTHGVLGTARKESFFWLIWAPNGIVASAVIFTLGQRSRTSHLELQSACLPV